MAYLEGAEDLVNRWIIPALGGLVVTLVVVSTSVGRLSPSPDPHDRVMPAAPAGQVMPAAPVKQVTELLDEARVQAMRPAQWKAIARRSSIIVLNSWDYHLIPTLKRANPAVQVWVYKNLSGVRSDDCLTATDNCGSCAPGVDDSKFLSSGMGYCWVRRHHPDWLLHAAGTGRRLEFNGYPKTWETNYGSRLYLRQWIGNVIADVHRHGWDGVKVDNALTTADAYGLTQEYPTSAAVQRATYSALREVGPALQRAGIRAVYNVGFAPKFPGLWQRWLSAVDGLQQEFYLSFSPQPNAVGQAWTAYQAEIASCVKMHKSCWFHAGSHSDMVTSRTRNYALASYLLVADARQYLAVGDSATVNVTPCWSLGRPIGLEHRVRGEAWRRKFTAGIAVVNPTRSSVTADLGGTFYNADGQALSAITLGPASGVALGDSRPSACHGQLKSRSRHPRTPQARNGGLR